MGNQPKLGIPSQKTRGSTWFDLNTCILQYKIFDNYISKLKIIDWDVVGFELDWM